MQTFIIVGTLINSHCLMKIRRSSTTSWWCTTSKLHQYN